MSCCSAWPPHCCLQLYFLFLLLFEYIMYYCITGIVLPLLCLAGSQLSALHCTVPLRVLNLLCPGLPRDQCNRQCWWCGAKNTIMSQLISPYCPQAALRPYMMNSYNSCTWVNCQSNVLIRIFDHTLRRHTNLQYEILSLWSWEGLSNTTVPLNSWFWLVRRYGFIF